MFLRRNLSLILLSPRQWQIGGSNDAKVGGQLAAYFGWKVMTSTLFQGDDGRIEIKHARPLPLVTNKKKRNMNRSYIYP